MRSSSLGNRLLALKERILVQWRSDGVKKMEHNLNEMKNEEVKWMRRKGRFVREGKRQMLC